MPRYYFHVRESDTYYPDEEGVQLPDREAVQNEAVRGARSILASEALLGKLPLGGRIEVSDEEGRQVLVLPFRDTVVLDG